MLALFSSLSPLSVREYNVENRTTGVSGAMPKVDKWIRLMHHQRTHSEAMALT